MDKKPQTHINIFNSIMVSNITFFFDYWLEKKCNYLLLKKNRQKHKILIKMNNGQQKTGDVRTGKLNTHLTSQKTNIVGYCFLLYKRRKCFKILTICILCNNNIICTIFYVPSNAVKFYIQGVRANWNIQAQLGVVGVL